MKTATEKRAATIAGKKALKRTCPDCGAPSGKLCRDERGRTVTALHAARRTEELPLTPPKKKRDSKKAAPPKAAPGLRHSVGGQDECLECGHTACPIWPDCSTCRECEAERERAGTDAKIEEYERTVGAEPGPSRIELARLRLDGGTQPRATIDQGVVEEYAAAYRSGIPLPALVAFYDGESYWLADGFHRATALRQLERTEVDVDVRQGTRRDAVLFSCSANATHGLRRTNADKRRAVLVLLEDEEWSKRSDRWIATHCAVDPSTVGVYRRELAAGRQVLESNTSDEPAYREGQDGKRYPVTRHSSDRTQEDPSGVEVIPEGSTEPAPAAEKPKTWRDVLGVGSGADNATVVQLYRSHIEALEGAERAALDHAKGVALSQWETNPELARQMAELALGSLNLDRPAVLEPSAGLGTLVQAVREVAPAAHITAHEIDPTRSVALERARADVIHIGDFFGWARPSRPYDVAVMNTPYENGLDGMFLERAMECARRVVALLRTNALHGRDRFQRVWHLVERGEWRMHDLAYLTARPEFAGPVDGTARSDFVVVHLVHETQARYSMTRVQWW